MAKIFAAILTGVLFFCVQCADGGVCINEDPCVCQLDEHSKIDLSQVSKNLKPDEFLEDGDTHGNNFYFHGCQDGVFNATKEKINTTQTVYKGSLIRAYVTGNVNTTYVKSVGNSTGIKFIPDENVKGAYEIIYKSGENVTARIRLVCDNSHAIKVLSVDDITPLLSLLSPHACVIRHQPGLSTGSVLLIIFFIALGVYLIGGAAVLYFIRGARGLELIPNIDFWRSLPGLVKDGVIFLFSGCNTSSIATPETYDRI